MKKENVVKKVLLSSLKGFPIGVTLLMVAYASIYFIAGEEVFSNEISQLQNIKTLIYQVVISGLAYYIAFIGTKTIVEDGDREKIKKHPYKSILARVVICFLSILVALALLYNSYIFTENMKVMNAVTLTIAFVIYLIGITAEKLKERKIVNQINKKLEKRDSK